MQIVSSYLNFVPLTYYEVKEIIAQETEMHPVTAVFMLIFPIIGILLVCYLGARKIQLAMISETEQKVSEVGENTLQPNTSRDKSSRKQMLKTCISVTAVGLGIVGIGLALKYYFNLENLQDIDPLPVDDLNVSQDVVINSNVTISNSSTSFFENLSQRSPFELKPYIYYFLKPAASLSLSVYNRVSLYTIVDIYRTVTGLLFVGAFLHKGHEILQRRRGAENNRRSKELSNALEALITNNDNKLFEELKKEKWWKEI